ncbi:MAG TPA: hypothetical protein VFD43_00890 [Planctomycetota bacterium]|nr:hypothetical protein [Planctomycetota bacterium]
MSRAQPRSNGPAARRAALAARVPAVLALALAVLSGPSPAQGSPPTAVLSTATAPFPNFESSPTRSLLLSPDGARLYVLNTPDARVEIYGVRLDPQRLVHLTYRDSVFTGLEPVSMALSPDDPSRLFVANLLSDSVSVVDLDLPGVVATIPAGDEPQDLLVEGGRLYVATARSAAAPDLVQPGDFVSNAVVIAQAEPPYAILQRVAIPGHKPRALVSAAGAIHVIPLNSGNRTTVLDAFEAEQVGLGQLDLDAYDQPFELNPVLALPELGQLAWLNTSFGVFGWQIPQTGRVVFDHEHPAFVPQLQDADIVALDPGSGALLPGPVTGVGTTLLAIARNPATGALWVANTEARNRTRFEPALSGRALGNRITIAAPQGQVSQVIELAPPTTAAEHAQPVALAFSDGPAGARAYVACLGDATIVALDAASGAVLDEFTTGALPSGLAVDDARGLLFVHCRGDQTVRAYDLLAGHAQAGRARALACDPEPQAVRQGRIHLYDARAESGAGTGNMSCASCHVSGHTDFVAWDLGDPAGGIGYFSPDLMQGVLAVTVPEKLANKKSIMTHPMKGPMATQSLRGLLGGPATPLHWRGDRRFFQNFRGAFRGLLGGDGISPAAMQEFASFVASLAYAPNPHQPRDRVYTGDAAAGRTLFGATPGVPGKEYNALVPGNVTCIDCHSLDPAAGNFTGSQATVNFDGESQLFNTAQLRGAYEKEFPQLTGTGLLHDGTIRDIAEFLDFEPPGTGVSAFPLLTAADRAQVTAFVRAWDTGLSPLVGGQYTAAAGSDTQALYDFLDLAEVQAMAPHSNVDLVGKGQVLLPGGGALPFGLRFGVEPGTRSQLYEVDNGGWVSRGSLVSAVGAGTIDVTFTCVPPGLGTRLGLDRDEDGLYDAIERQWGSNAARPDTDQDGYDDALEVLLGADPLLFDARLGSDVAAPQVSAVEARDVFADTATLQVVTSEAAAVLVELGTAPGDFSLASFADAELRRRHDLVLSGLPAGTELHWRVTATDKNGNAGTAEGGFTTRPPLFHVDAITLETSGSGPYTVTGTVAVVDQAGAPVAGIPVRVLWGGDLGGAESLPLATTDAAGVASFALGPWTPAAPTTVTLSPVTIGHPADVTHPYYIGSAGDEPTFFYEQAANQVNYRSIELP